MTPLARVKPGDVGNVGAMEALGSGRESPRRGNEMHRPHVVRARGSPDRTGVEWPENARTDHLHRSKCPRRFTRIDGILHAARALRALTTDTAAA
jgi:hypothetical protein